MKKAFYSLAVIVVGFAVIVAIASVVLGRDRLLSLFLGPVDRVTIDFAKLGPSDRPNRYLVCPVNYCGTAPDRTSPVYSETPAALRARWEKMVAQQPRVSVLGTSPDGLQVDYVQRSAVFGFPDTITVRFVPVSNTRTSVAIISRSHYGRSDLGVNRARIEQWLAELGKPG